MESCIHDSIGRWSEWRYSTLALRCLGLCAALQADGPVPLCHFVTSLPHCGRVFPRTVIHSRAASSPSYRKRKKPTDRNADGWQGSICFSKKIPCIIAKSLARRQPCFVLWLQYKKFSFLTKLRSTLNCETALQEKAKITDNADAYR